MNSDFVELLSLFNQFGVRYVVAGGYAVMYHTEPRFTKDLDSLILAKKAAGRPQDKLDLKKLERAKKKS